MTTAIPALKNPDLLRRQCLIVGQWIDARDGSILDVHDPATGSLLAQVPNMGATETRHAIEMAHAALAGWRNRTARERSVLMHRWFSLMVEHRDDLAVLMTAEQGKPLSEARGEVDYAASFVEWFAEEAKRVAGETLANTVAGQRLLVLKEPVGVCAAITPWNFPLAMITRKLAPAIAAGCTIIIKPAEQTPLSALALAYLAEQAGIPAGVINVITADSTRSITVGSALCDSPVVRKLSFTGSTAVGRVLMRQSAGTVKKLSLELGGNAPFIVFDDADLDAAVTGALQSKYRNGGQTCVCTNRFYVHDSLHDAFVEKLARGATAICVGNGFDSDVQQGPLIDAAALEKVEAHVADALHQGSRLVTGGKRHALGGNYFEPTVLADAHGGMRIAHEETFGPVAAVFRFHSDAEAIALANDTEYGLASYFYSRDIGRIWRVAEALEYGMVGINTGLMSNEVAPFGGVKQSGLGREGSRHGIEEYLELKYLCMGGI